MRYELHGLVVESELRLDAPRSNRDAELRVVLGDAIAKVGEAPAGRLLAESHRGDAHKWVVDEEGADGAWRFRYKGIGDFVFDHSRAEIKVHPVEGTDPAVLSVFIAGSVLGHFLSARGHAVLHAAAVETAVGVLAVAGPSGAGKSTLAGLLCASGAALVTDDALRIDLSGSGSARCYPGTDVLRLRPRAADLAEVVPGPAPAETADGRIGLKRSIHRGSTLELAAILLPRPSREAAKMIVARLAERDALHELLRCPRIGDWIERDPLVSYLDAAAKLARSVPVYRATVPWGPPFEPALAGELLAAMGLAGPQAATRI